MQTTLIIAGLAAVLFLCPSLFLAYRCGLRDGLALNQGAKVIKPIRSPVQIMEQRREAEAAKDAPESVIDKMLDGHARMMAFTGEISEKE